MNDYSIWTRLYDLIVPRRCAICERRLAITEWCLCGRCCLHLPRTDFGQAPYDNEMARRYWGLMPIEKAAALFFYESESEVTRVIKKMKYDDHPEIGVAMGRLVATELLTTRFFEDLDAIVAIPLAKNRERQRGFNQSREIARGIGEVTHLPILDKAVVRTHFNESQTHKTLQERRENVEDVFSLRDASCLRGKHLLLVDDVVTTGATTIACGQQLLRVEGVRLSILSLGFTRG